MNCSMVLTKVIAAHLPAWVTTLATPAALVKGPLTVPHAPCHKLQSCEHMCNIQCKYRLSSRDLLRYTVKLNFV
jgi:hypothetical protein